MTAIPVAIGVGVVGVASVAAGAVLYSELAQVDDPIVAPSLPVIFIPRNLGTPIPFSAQVRQLHATNDEIEEKEKLHFSAPKYAGSSAGDLDDQRQAAENRMKENDEKAAAAYDALSEILAIQAANAEASGRNLG